MTLAFPAVAFDVESTGRDKETARMVQAAIGWAQSAGEWHPDVRLVNPGIPIPAEATKIHGITDDQVADAAREGDVAADARDRMYGTWSAGGVVVGTNVVYDLTLLDRALERDGRPPLEICGPVIDTFVLDKAIDKFRKGSRKLEATCQVYGIPLDGAHDAGADSFAALRLAYRIIEAGVIPATFGGSGDGEFETPEQPLRDMSMEDLHQFQVEAYEYQQESLIGYFRRTGQLFDAWSTHWPVVPRGAVLNPSAIDEQDLAAEAARQRGAQ